MAIDEFTHQNILGQQVTNRSNPLDEVGINLPLSLTPADKSFLELCEGLEEDGHIYIHGRRVDHFHDYEGSWWGCCDVCATHSGGDDYD